MPYVALEDVTVHKVEGHIGSDEKTDANIDPFRSVTLSPGQTIGDDELHAHEKKLYADGKISHLLQKVSAAQARELEKMMAGGEDVNIKLIKDVITARSGEGASAKKTGSTSKSEDE